MNEIIFLLKEWKQFQFKNSGLVFNNHIVYFHFTLLPFLLQSSKILSA